LALMLLVVQLSEEGEIDVRLGDDEFDAGRVEEQARLAPVIFPDLLLDGRRDLVLFHTGAETDEGWVAMEVRRGEGCGAEQDRETLEVRDGCTGAVITPDDAERPRYPVRIEDGRVIVDLTPDGAPGRPPTTLAG